VARKFGFNLRIPPETSRVQNFCTELALFIRISQFECRATPQALVAAEKSASFVRGANAATGLYNNSV
jgi:hypothetical protein